MEREKHSISVRLNGKEQKVKEVAYEKQDDDSSLIPRPNNVLDFKKRQAERKRNEQPYWDDGNRERSPGLPFKRKKKALYNSAKPHLSMTLLAAICSALVIGIGMGLVVLTLFTGDPAEGTEASSTSADAIPAFSGTESGLPVLTVEVVQGGAFEAAEKGMESVEILQERGLAALLTEHTDPFYMFIGLGGDRAEAGRISTLYQEYGQDTYVKSYRIEGQAVTGQAEEVASWFGRAMEQYKELLRLSVDGLTGGTLTTAEKVTGLEQTLDALLAERDQVFSQLSEEAHPSALALGDALVKGKDQLKLYAETEDTAALWGTQQALLEALLAYEQLIAALS
ncbi:hypothetical protein M3212_03075 [Alkalihalobacillus oceani]|uniref:hypothetical protein n=1 Tax=Halalkalibacter oceani TaxID=1653776 RepID=UPI00203DB04F|nr:hypothetical protein [Halalkalibacter oceani]MCM3759766.1 hypothetical protein [Halalkalibacter oceani]